MATAALTARPSLFTPLLAAGALLAVVTADQISKALALEHLLDGPAQGAGPIWFRLVANRGALMGLPLPGWVLVGAVATVMALAALSLRRPAPHRVALAWGLLVGGATGNLVDRFQHRPRFPDHAVVDWIASSALPTFNLADIAIIAGLVLLATWTSDRPRHGEKATT